MVDGPQYTPPPPGGGGPSQADIDRQRELEDFQMAMSEANYNLSKKQFSWTKDQAEERKANIASSMAEIEKMFGEREPMYGRLAGESRALNLEQLGVYEKDAAREMNFALARAGNVGGSVEVDRNRDLAEKMGLGVASIEQHAQGQADTLRAQDQQLRGSLMGLAASGGITGDMTGRQGTQALQGLSRTANYMPNMGQTFEGLSSNIGTAGKGGFNQQQQNQFSFG